MIIPDSIYKELGLQKPETEEEKEEKIKEMKKNGTLDNATKENPLFFRVSGDSLENTLVACTGTQMVEFEENRYYSRTAKVAKFRVLEGPYKSEGRQIEIRDLNIKEFLPANNELLEKYRNAVEAIECRIITNVYPEVEVPDGLSMYEIYCMNIEPIERHSYIPKSVHSLDEAQEWLLKNHPDEYVGHSIYTNIGDFSLGAIPQAYSEDTKWATKKGRYELAQQAAERLGITIPPYEEEKEMEA